MKQIFITLTLLLMAATEAWADEANIGSITYNSTLEAYEIRNANNLNDLAVYVNGTGSYSTGGSENTAHDCTGLTFRLTDDITPSMADHLMASPRLAESMSARPLVACKARTMDVRC